MRKFLYFLRMDDRLLKLRLDRLAESGLELISVDGLFTGEFEATSRKDLSYQVFPYGSLKLFPRLDDGARFGYRLIGGFNGMAIYASRPCENLKPEALREKLKADGCLHESRWEIIPWTVLLLVFAVGFWLLSWQMHGAVGWMLSYLGISMRWMAVLCSLAAAVNLILLPTRLAGWIHGLTPWVLGAGALAGVCVGMLDERSEVLEFVLILVAVGIACALSFWRKNKIVACIPGACALVILCLGLIFPNVDRVDFDGTMLHRDAAQFPVVRLDDLWEGETVKACGLTVRGTILVRTWEYWEVSEDHSVSCKTCRCLTSGIAGEMAQYLSHTTPGSADNPDLALLSDGRSVSLTTSDCAITSEQRDVISARTLH